MPFKFPGLVRHSRQSLLGITEGQVTDAGTVQVKPAGGSAKAAGFGSQQAALSVIPNKLSPEYLARKKARRDKWKARRRERRANRICCICRIPAHQLPFGGFMAIDHDHTTEFIRGWLCDKCNGRLGSFEHHTKRGVIWTDSGMLWWIEKYYDRIIAHLLSNTGIKYKHRNKFLRRP